VKNKVGEKGILSDSVEEEDEQSLFDNYLQLTTQLRAAAILLRIAFLCGGYPHQQFSFGFNWLIYGRLHERAARGEAVARRLVGSPADVADNHVNAPFSTLHADLRNAYLKTSLLGDAVIDTCMEPLVDACLRRLWRKRLHPGAYRLWS